MTEKQNKHPFQRLQTQLSELIASTPPGNRLPAEPELAKTLGVSRATLREGMRTFEGQGLIRRRQGVGTFVVAQSKVIEAGLAALTGETPLLFAADGGNWEALAELAKAPPILPSSLPCLLTDSSKSSAILAHMRP